VKGIFCIQQAILGYAKHGLNAKQIGERIRAMGKKIGDSTIRRQLQSFRATGWLPEKEPHRTTVARREQRANAQNEQMHQESAMMPVTTDISVENSDFPVIPSTMSPTDNRMSPAEMAYHVVKERINDDWEMDTTGLDIDQFVGIAKNQNAMIDSLHTEVLMNGKMLDFITSKYCYTDSTGGFSEHAPLKIIKNLLPELSAEDREELINTLLSPIQ
jgi:hypothetical protein